MCVWKIDWTETISYINKYTYGYFTWVTLLVVACLFLMTAICGNFHYPLFTYLFGNIYPGAL